MTRASGVGSMPGSTDAHYREAVRVVLDLLPDLPHVPELPGRGAASGMTGRALGVVSTLGFDLQPAGWRLTDSPGVDHRRARSQLAQDLDVVEELAAEYAGPFKTQLAGPWTLAATVEKPRGDRVLSDHGARRELAQAIAEGVTDHVADLRRRVPGATDLLVQVDEPALPAVLTGSVPTASGFGRHRTVHPPEASEALGWVFDAVTAAGGVPVAHCCSPDVPLRLLRGAGARGVSLDLAALPVSAYDDLAELLDAEGEWALLGAAPSLPPPSGQAGAAADERSVTEAVERVLDMLGLDPSALTVVTPTCGLAGAGAAYAKQVLGLCAAAARSLG